MDASHHSVHGLGFPESLRWRQGAVWFSDMFRSRVVRWVPGNQPETVLDAATGCPEVPGGLGWLPDSTLLVVDCLERTVVAVKDGEVRIHARLDTWLSHPANDMVVDHKGVAFVGGYGFDPDSDEPSPSRLVRISPDGRAAPWGPELVFPNGCEMTANGDLVVAETYANRVSRLRPDGTVCQSWIVAGGPDGLTLDASESAIVACAFAGTVVSAVSGRELWRAPAVTGPGAGPAGCYDVVRLGHGAYAVATASLDEDLAQRVDTGSVRLVIFGEG